MRIKFDSSHNAVTPVFILTTRNGHQLGAIPANNIHFKDKLNSYKELTFTVYKYDNGVRNNIWYKVDNFKLCYCPDWNMYFQMTVEVNENDYTEKNVSCTSLGEAELSQIMIYNTEINTENDILRDDYKPTVLWDEDCSKASLLDRIMEKAPHYKIKHVDVNIRNIQRTFTFDGTSIYDAFQDIAEEIGCLFIIEAKKTRDKDIERSIWVYDLESTCTDCNYRGEFVDTCPNCGSHNISSGYGKDTTIFCSVDNLAEDINYSIDADNVKNCFKLEAGDDLMTATVINCNPTGTAYMYYFNSEFKEDMSKELSSALDEYTEKTSYYQSQHKFNLDGKKVSAYNALIDKYHSTNEDLEKIGNVVTGYPSLMNAVYSAINTDLYLNSGMMPTMDLPVTAAENEVKKLNAINNQSISVMDLDTATETTVTSAALSYARVIVDNRYKVKVNTKSYSSGKWTGSFKVECYSDEEDTGISDTVTLSVNDNYQSFVEQKIDNLLNKSADESSGIVALFKLDDNKFKTELKKYCLVSLSSFYESCQACINILIKQGVGDPTVWEGKNPNLYEVMYLPYLKKLSYIQAEIIVREDEISVVEGKYGKDGKLEKEGILTILDKERDKVQAALDFKTAIGDELWEEFCSYRRESTYQNDNYISDGLNDRELFRRALEFLENAQKEIYKSASLQHRISATLKNLLTMKEFAPITDCFEVGNWLKIRIDDKIYKLRLIEYEVNFDDLAHLNVEFSDAIDTINGISDLQSVLKQAVSISSSYNTVQRQAEEGNQSFKYLNDWVDKGLNVTNQKIVSSADNQAQVWDRHGMLFREYDEFSDNYSDIQLKIINSTMVITDDNWHTVKTAVGRYYYYDPRDNYKLKTAYGIIGETIVGKVILGENLGIYTDNGSMSFTNEGLNVTNGTNTFNVNPNSSALLTINNGERDLLRIDDKGQLYISGDGTALDINANDAVLDLSTRITQNADAIQLEATTARGEEDALRAALTVTATEIRAEVEDKEKNLYSSITQTAEQIRSEVGAVDEGLRSSITQTASEIRAELKDAKEGLETDISVQAGRITSEIARAESEEGKLSTKITQTEKDITAEVNRASEAEGKLSARITANAEGITSEVERAKNEENTMKSTIQQNANAISLVVTSKNNGTSFEVNSEAIRLAWNKCSNYIQFENGAMNIYSSSTHSNNSLLAKFDDKGIGFYYQGKYVGKIGTNKMNSDSTSRGLVFDLDGDQDDEGNDYMCWASKKKGDSSYTIKLAYYRKDDLLRADCPFEFQSKVQFDSDVIFNKGISASNITGHIQRSQLADNCINTSELIDGAVTTDKIASGAVTSSEVSNSYYSGIIRGITSVSFSEGKIIKIGVTKYKFENGLCVGTDGTFEY